jgi:hypothetical protein
MNTTKPTPRVPGGIYPRDCFMKDVTVGVIPSLGVIEETVLDPRFAYEPAPGAEWLPVTASLDVDDPDSLLIVNCTVMDNETGELRIRFFNCNGTSTDFNQRFITFFVWPPVAEPTP